MTGTGMTAAESGTRDRTGSAGARVEHPRTVGEAAELLRDTSGSVLVKGGATKLDWAGRVVDPELVIGTAELSGVLTHNPQDMTASVRAGTTLAELQDQLAESGQWLALDPPTAGSGATVGGLLAAGDSGPSRLRYGALRDLVIGVTLVLADGHVARSGGHVIKNVAGYDLAKLAYGSLGSLALVAEVVVRLHPQQPAARVTAGPATAAQATTAALALMASPLEPTALEWVSDERSGGATGTLFVRTDGTPSYVEAATERVDALLATHGVATGPLDDAEVDAAWQGATSATIGGPGETIVRISGLPSDFDRLTQHARRFADQFGLDLTVVSSVALGMHTVRLGPGTRRTTPRWCRLCGLRRSPRAPASCCALGPPSWTT